jgi:hypothetical protein
MYVKIICKLNAQNKTLNKDDLKRFDYHMEITRRGPQPKFDVIMVGVSSLQNLEKA